MRELHPNIFNSDSEMLRPPLITTKAKLESDSARSQRGWLEEFGELTPLEGRILVLVDDTLDSGTQVHRNAMEVLRSRFRFGRYGSIQNDEGKTFNGRRIRQLPNFEIETSMADYVERKIRTVQLEPGAGKEPSRELTATESGALRGATMCQMWAARQGRHDILGPVAL